jgi:hypothetical protein
MSYHHKNILFVKTCPKVWLKLIFKTSLFLEGEYNYQIEFNKERCKNSAPNNNPPIPKWSFSAWAALVAGLKTSKWLELFLRFKSDARLAQTQKSSFRGGQ